MKYTKGSPEFEFNLDAMHEMEDHIPMTRPERESLHFWVQHDSWEYENYLKPDASGIPSILD